MATKQELQAQALRKANEGLGDIEFASDIQQMVGPGYQTVDPSRARVRSFGVPTNLQGFNVPADYSGGEDDRYSFRGKQLPVEPDTVNAVEPHFDKQTWAHEFRHDDVSSEHENRKKDAMFAKSKKEWNEALRSMKGYYDRPTTTRKVELDLIKRLEESEKRLVEEDPVNRYWKKRRKKLTKDNISIDEQIAIQDEVLEQLVGRE